MTVATAFTTLAFLRRNTANFDDIYTRKTLYCTLLGSVLEYAASVWAPYQATFSFKIEGAQRKFTRYALRNLPWIDPLNLAPYE